MIDDGRTSDYVDQGSLEDESRPARVGPAFPRSARAGSSPGGAFGLDGGNQEDILIPGSTCEAERVKRTQSIVPPARWKFRARQVAVPGLSGGCWRAIHELSPTSALDPMRTSPAVRHLSEVTRLSAGASGSVVGSGMAQSRYGRSKPHAPGGAHSLPPEVLASVLVIPARLPRSRASRRCFA